MTMILGWRVLKYGIAIAGFGLGATQSAMAYEKDLHFSVTFALARAVGWTQEEALVIASSDQGVDESKETVAALELGGYFLPVGHWVIPSAPSLTVHQAPKNFVYHGFATASDKSDEVASGVIDNVPSRHTRPQIPNATSNQDRTLALVSIGIDLHYVQDAFSHNGYGGTCMDYKGSCVGHAFDNARDKAQFFFNGWHEYNPDHPATKQKELLSGAINQTVAMLAEKLSQYRQSFPASPSMPYDVPATRFADLVDWLHDPSTLILEDESRQECNRETAARWLYLFLSATRASEVPSGILNTATAPACCIVEAGKTRVPIPTPRYPRLSKEAAPRNLATDGTYQLVGNDTAFDLKISSLKIERHSDGVFSFEIQISNESDFVTLPGNLQIVVIFANLVSFGTSFPFNMLPKRESVKVTGKVKGPVQEDNYVVIAEVGRNDSSETWNDANIANDRGTCKAVPVTQVRGGDVTADPINNVVSQCEYTYSYSALPAPTTLHIVQ